MFPGFGYIRLTRREYFCVIFFSSFFLFLFASAFCSIALRLNNILRENTSKNVKDAIISCYGSALYVFLTWIVNRILVSDNVEYCRVFKSKTPFVFLINKGDTGLTSL